MEVLPRLSDSDVVELYHLRSYPSQLIVSAAGSFLVQTSGIALRSTSTRQLVVLEYRPANYSACFLPVVHLRENNKSTLHWDKRSVLFYKTELDKKYWQQSTFLGRINGVVYENYVKWVEDYISRDKTFVPQSICSSANEISCFVKAETWETFLTDSLETFASLAVQMSAIIPPRAKEMHLLSNTEPLRFSLSDAGARGEDSSSGSSGGGAGLPFTSQPESGSEDQSDRSVPIGGGGVSSGGDQDPGYGTGGLDVRMPGAPPPGFRGGEKRGLWPGGRERHRKNNSSGGPVGVGGILGSGHSNHFTGSSVASAASSVSVSVSDTSNSDSNGNGNGNGNSANVTGLLSHEKSDSNFNKSSGVAEEMAAMPSVSESDMAQWYASLMVCMQEYTMEDFTSALGSCLTDRVGYIHIDGDDYYRISPRFPFALMQEYLQPIPTARVAAAEAAGASDWAISAILLLAALVGLVLSLRRLSLLDGCWAAAVRRSRSQRRRVGAGAPAEGGYCSSASELPVYRGGQTTGSFSSSAWGFGGSGLMSPAVGLGSGGDKGKDRDKDKDKDKFSPAPIATAAERRGKDGSGSGSASGWVSRVDVASRGGGMFASGGGGSHYSYSRLLPRESGYVGEDVDLATPQHSGSGSGSGAGAGIVAGAGAGARSGGGVSFVNPSPLAPAAFRSTPPHSLAHNPGSASGSPTSFSAASSPELDGAVFNSIINYSPRSHG